MCANFYTPVAIMDCEDVETTTNYEGPWKEINKLISEKMLYGIF